MFGEEEATEYQNVEMTGEITDVSDEVSDEVTFAERFLSELSEQLDSFNDWAEVFKSISKILNIRIDNNFKLTVTQLTDSQRAKKKIMEPILGIALSNFVKEPSGRPAEPENFHFTRLFHKTKNTESTDYHGKKNQGFKFFIVLLVINL